MRRRVAALTGLLALVAATGHAQPPTAPPPAVPVVTGLQIRGDRGPVVLPDLEIVPVGNRVEVRWDGHTATAAGASLRSGVLTLSGGGDELVELRAPNGTTNRGARIEVNVGVSSGRVGRVVIDGTSGGRVILNEAAAAPK